MISALAMCLAASAAKRIIRTAPIAKFGAISTFGIALRGGDLARLLGQCLDVEACSPMTTWAPDRRHRECVLQRRVWAVKSTTTSRAPLEHLGRDVSRQGVRSPDELHVVGLATAAQTWPIRPGARDADADHDAASGLTVETARGSRRHRP